MKYFYSISIVTVLVLLGGCGVDSVSISMTEVTDDGKTFKQTQTDTMQFVVESDVHDDSTDVVDDVSDYTTNKITDDTKTDGMPNDEGLLYGLWAQDLPSNKRRIININPDHTWKMQNDGSGEFAFENAGTWEYTIGEYITGELTLLDDGYAQVGYYEVSLTDPETLELTDMSTDDVIFWKQVTQ